MAEKNKTCQSTENLSDSDKNGRPKTSHASNLMEEFRNSPLTVNMGKSKNSTKEETSCTRNSLLKMNANKLKNSTMEEKSCANKKTKEGRKTSPNINRKQSIDELTVKEGCLSVHNKALLKKSKQCYFRLLPKTAGTRAQLQQYSKAESGNQNGYQPELVISALDVNSVVPLEEPEHAFVIQYRSEVLKLSAEDDLTQKSWIKAIRKVLLSENQVTFTDVKIPRAFDVFISKETQKKIGDGSLVELSVEYGSIAVIAATNILLARWPIEKLRAFGFDGETFMVKTGRNAEHGEGTYSFITKQGEEIHRTVKAAKIKDSSFDGPLPGMCRQTCIPEGNSPLRPNHEPPNYIPSEGIYQQFSMYDPIYEPVGVMLQNPNKLPGSKAPLTNKARYPTDPGSARQPVQQGSAIYDSPVNSAPQMSNVKAASTASNDREVVIYDDVRPWFDHSYKNIVTSETAFPIFPKGKDVPKEQPSADESLYAAVDPSKKTNNKKDRGASLIPEHKRVTLPHDARGYTLTGNTRL